MKKKIQTFFREQLNYKKLCIILTSLIIAVLITLFYLKYPLKNQVKLENSLNNVLQFSGIYSALLITFIVSKIFQIRQEKISRLKEIITLSNKVTDFRRICQVLYDNYDFWDAQMQRTVKSKFKGLSYFHIHIDSYYYIPKYKDLITSFNEWSPKPGASFYLALKSLVVSDKRSFQLELYDEFDHNVIYSFDIISKWVGAGSANCFFYYLDHKWHSYETLFKLELIPRDERGRIEELATKIDERRYGGETFSRPLLVKIGNHFESEILPRLFQLTYYNKTGITGPLNFIIYNLLIIMIFGVFVPIILSSGQLKYSLMYLISKISIIIISITIFYFVVSFKRILKNEIEIDVNHY